MHTHTLANIHSNTYTCTDTHHTHTYVHTQKVKERDGNVEVLIKLEIVRALFPQTNQEPDTKAQVIRTVREYKPVTHPES